MAVRTILVGEQPMLRTRCTEVTYWGESLTSLIQDLMETMHAHHGIGLAAPQIGVPLQVAVMKLSHGDVAVINPIISAADGEELGVESCLSFPDMVLQVPRPTSVVVEARDAAGLPIRLALTGRDARVACHEIDHLQGVLFFDHLPDEELWTQMLTQLGAFAEDDSSMVVAHESSAMGDCGSAMLEDHERSVMKHHEANADETSMQESHSPAVLGSPEPHVEELQLALDMIADATWKVVLATELLRDYADAVGLDQADVDRLGDVARQLEDHQDWWEQQTQV